jgi:hypothetical protein
MKVLVTISISFFFFVNGYSQLFFEGVLDEGDFDSGMNSFICGGDLNSDGADELITVSTTGMAYLCMNNGSGVYTAHSNLNTVTDGNGMFVDVDNDNDLDIILIGGATGNLYKNDGNNNFSLYGSPFVTCSRSTIDTADIENDGDIDVIIAGEWELEIYLNDGSGNFTGDPNNNSIPVIGPGVCFEDFNNDGATDLLISGDDHNGSAGSITKYYQNNGSGVLIEQSTNIMESFYSLIETADLNGDGNMDVIQTGLEYDGMTSTNIAKVYLNDGSAVFTEYASIITPVFYGYILPGDLDLDGDTDLVVSGYLTGISRNTSVYLNNGSGDFTLFTDYTDFGVGGDSNGGAILDLEGDGDLDIFQVGQGGGGAYESIHKQLTCFGDLDTSVTINGTELISNTIGATYYWFDCNTLQNIPFSENQSFTPPYNGDFAVVIDAFGCIDTSACATMSILSTDNPLLKKFQSFPNPVNDYFQIHSTRNISQVTIFDHTGKLLYSLPVNSMTAEFDMTNYSPGIYIFNCLTEKGNEIVKVIKN